MFTRSLKALTVVCLVAGILIGASQASSTYEFNPLKPGSPPLSQGFRNNPGNQIMSLMWEFSLTNQSLKVSDLEFNVDMPFDGKTLFQQVLSDKVLVDAHSDIKFEYGRNGNTVANISVGHVKPKQIVDITVKEIVALRKTQVHLDAGKITDNYSGINPQYLVSSNNPLIVTEAKRLKASSSNALELIQKIHSYVYSTITYDPGWGKPSQSPYDNKGAVSAITHHMGVCQDFADLEVALLRANGIPSRVDTGVATNSGLLHSWVEIYIPPYGWVPADPTWASTENLYRTVGYLGPDHLLYSFGDIEYYLLKPNFSLSDQLTTALCWTKTTSI